MSTKNLPLKIMAFAIGGVFLAAAFVFVGVQIQNGQFGVLPEIMDFPPIQKVSENSRLYLAFPEKMDKTDTIKNIEGPEGLKGNAYFKDNVLIFEPEKKLESGKTYAFHLSSKTLTAAGKPVNREMEYKFTVAGPPKVSSRFPLPDAADIPGNSKITLIFDRPIIPLSALQGNGAKVNANDLPLSISPYVAGRWRWLSTAAVQFEPAGGLTLATNYTVTAPPGITDILGDKTTEDFSWSFTTLRPKIIAGDPPGNGPKVGPTPKLILSFNQDTDLNSARELTKLYQDKNVKNPKGEIGLPLEELAFNISYFEEKIEGKTTVYRNRIAVEPQSPLPLDSYFLLKAMAGIRGLEGDLGSEAEFSVRFATVGDMKAELADQENYGLHLKFTNPVNDETLKGAIEISPKPDKWEEAKIQTYEWSDHRDLYIYPALKPSTEYTITLAGTIEDDYGQKLAGPYTFTKKMPPLDPDVYIESKGDFGIFEAGHSPIYRLHATNVSRLGVEFARVPFTEFLKIRQTRMKNYESRPDLSKFISYKTIAVPLKNELDESELVEFKIEKETGGKLVPGIYALSVRAPEYKKTWGDFGPIVHYRYFTLTGTALTLKYSSEKALVWAVDMETGAPVEGMDIAFHTLDGDIKLTGKTDKNGFFEAPFEIRDFKTQNNEWMPEFWVTGSKGGDFAFVGSEWNNGMEPWQFGVSEDIRGASQPDMRLDSYIYTERSLYRAGDTVHYKAILRLRDRNGVYQVPKGKQALVMVQDAEGNEIYSKTLKVNEFGSVSDDFPTDPKASLGLYSINLHLIPEESVDSNWAYHSFYVLAYRKPEYKVEIEPVAADYFDGDTLEFGLDGSYYFGAPMDGAKVHFRATSTDYWFNRYTEGWYSFALDEAWCFWDCAVKTVNVTEGEGKLDGKGHFKISFPVKLDDKAISQVINVEADVTDVNNQVVSARNSVPVHKAQIYVGVQPDDYAVAPGKKAKVNVIALTPQGEAAEGQKVLVKLFSREWNTIKKKNVDGGYYYENEPKDTFIADTKVTTDEKGKAVAELYIEKGGSYRVVAEAEDDNGRLAKAGASLYAFSDTYVNWPRSNNDKIEVVADKPMYKVGDTAKLLVKSPYQGEGVKALITVERENVITKQVLDVKSNAEAVEIPITKNLIPNAYVSAVIIKARQGETFDENGKDAGAPAFKIGYVKLKVETEQKELNVRVSTDKAKYGPGETVKVGLTATDSENKPVVAEISLGAVDMSVEALLGFQLPDLVARFYSDRGLGVRTAEMLTYLIEAFKPGSKGGGGGDVDAKERKNFKDTAYWNPNILTGKDGKAEISFALPDNLTTWHLLAIAQTKDHLFGAKDLSFIETKQVIVRPIRPRFAVVGDEVEMAAAVHNYTDKEQNFKVSLIGSGWNGLARMEQNVKVEPEEQAKLVFPVKITRAEKAVFRFKAEGNGVTDEIEESIPLYDFGTPQAVATSGVADQAALEEIYIPAPDEYKDGIVTASFSPTLAVYLPQGLKYLMDYPYGCAEQTVSSFIGNVALATLQGYDAFRLADRATLEKNITAGLEKLYTYQRGDGGFGYWQESDRSYPFLTAYIVFALEMTRNAGFAVDHNVIGRATEYLTSALRGQDMGEKIDLAARAYILYVLSQNRSVDLNLLNNLYEKRGALPIFSKAYLAMAYENSAPVKAKKILDEMMAAIKIDSRGAHFEEMDGSGRGHAMNTNAKTTALALQALLKIDPNNEMSPKLIRGLLAMRQNGYWDTTQATVASIFTLADYLKITKELDADYTLSMSVNGKNQLAQKFDQSNILTLKEWNAAFEDLEQDSLNKILMDKGDNKGKGRFYYDLTMAYFLMQDKIEPMDQGISIKRQMEPLKGSPAAPKVNGTYKVKLTITVPEDRNLVAVNSPLPAGFEAIDFTFQTSQQDFADEVKRGEGDWWNNNLWRFNHREFRDDEVFLFADFLPTGVYEYEYLVRATTPGHFLYRPARAYEMYFPETFGQTEGGWVEVKK
ncbi:Ig-like domain-containing protein [Candidatus Peregrinibacteria bacterium]|nr:Ig-like domain-containing protein [Candidatus Peregrinibacteria bacterium]